MRPVQDAALRLGTYAGEIEAIETRLLLEGIQLRYGYDFREYSPAPLRRGLMTAMVREGVHTISAYQDRILREPSVLQGFLKAVGVNVTTMFRDPETLVAIREEVVPLLKTYPSSRIWVAGCASGEEVYGLAIVLEEAGVLERCTIYATDLSEETLAVARTGAYPLDRVRRYEEAYIASGGGGRLSDHYQIADRSARFDRKLASRVTWQRHNLVTDGSFNDFHLVICANVLIYFKESLQARAHRLIYDSLVRGGFLALGKRESMLACPEYDHYEQVRSGVNLYRKIRW